MVESKAIIPQESIKNKEKATKEQNIRDVFSLLTKEIKKDQRNIVITPSKKNRKNLLESTLSLKYFLEGKPEWTGNVNDNEIKSNKLGKLLIFMSIRTDSIIESTKNKVEKKAISAKTKKLIDFIRVESPTKEEIITTLNLEPNFDEKLENIISENQLETKKVEIPKEKKLVEEPKNTIKETPKLNTNIPV